MRSSSVCELPGWCLRSLPSLCLIPGGIQWSHDLAWQCWIQTFPTGTLVFLKSKCSVSKHLNTFQCDLDDFLRVWDNLVEPIECPDPPFPYSTSGCLVPSHPNHSRIFWFHDLSWTLQSLPTSQTFSYKNTSVMILLENDIVQNKAGKNIYCSSNK